MTNSQQVANSPWSIPSQVEKVVVAQVYLEVKEATTRKGDTFFKFEFSIQAIGERDRLHKTNQYDKGFQTKLLPSISSLFDNPSDVNGQWMLIKWAFWKDTDETNVQWALDNDRDVFTNENNKRYVNKQTLEFLKHFPDEEAATKHLNEMSTTSPVNDTVQTSAEGSADYNAKLALIETVVGTATNDFTVDMEKLGNSMVLLSPHFTIDSPEVVTAINDAEIPF